MVAYEIIGALVLGAIIIGGVMYFGEHVRFVSNEEKHDDNKSENPETKQDA